MKNSQKSIRPWVLLLLLHVVLLLLLVPSCHAQQQSFTIGGYLPDYRSYINVNATAPHLTDLILFSIQPHARGMIGGCCLDASHYQLGRDAKAAAAEAAQAHHHGTSNTNTNTNTNFRLWVTIGGGGRSDSFKIIAADPKKRDRLIQSMVRLWYVTTFSSHRRRLGQS
jgi:GH18 family chitinase